MSTMNATMRTLIGLIYQFFLLCYIGFYSDFISKDDGLFKQDFKRWSSFLLATKIVNHVEISDKHREKIQLTKSSKSQDILPVVRFKAFHCLLQLTILLITCFQPEVKQVTHITSTGTRDHTELNKHHLKKSHLTMHQTIGLMD